MSEVFDLLSEALDKARNTPSTIFNKELELMPKSKRYISLKVEGLSAVSKKQVGGNQYAVINGLLLNDLNALQYRTGDLVSFNVGFNAYMTSLSKYLKFNRLDLEDLDVPHIQCLERTNNMILTVKNITIIGGEK